jgi:hypothetical protein
MREREYQIISMEFAFEEIRHVGFSGAVFG